MRRVVNRRTIGSASVLGLLLSAGLSALPTTPVSAKPVAQQPNGISISLFQKATSSTHKHLTVNINGSSSGEGDSVSFGLSAKGSKESHSWNFALSNGSLTYNPATGKGSLKSGKQIKPFGSLKFKLKGGKKHVTTCHAYKSVTQTMKLIGSWKFDTKSKGKHKWGKASRKGHFKGSAFYSFGQFDGSCGPTGGNTTCSPGVNWSASDQGASFEGVRIGGHVAGKHSTITASRTVRLSKPQNATRFDSANFLGVKDKHQKFSVKNGAATVKVGSAPGVSGSATISGPTAAPGATFNCGKHSSETFTNWDSSYKNGKKPLTVHEQIEGAFKLKDIGLNSPTEAANISKTKVTHR